MTNRIDLSSPGVTKGRSEVAAALDEELARQGLEAASVDVNALTDAVVQRLLDQPSANELRRLMASAWEFATTAISERPDLFGYGQSIDTMAMVMSDAVESFFSEDADEADFDLDPRRMGAVLRRVTYKPGWNFALVQIPPDGVGIRVRAEVPDTKSPGQMFTLSRTVPVSHGDVLAAAFNGVMLIEAHEAMERMLVDGKKSFDPHWPLDSDPRVRPTSDP